MKADGINRSLSILFNHSILHQKILFYNSPPTGGLILNKDSDKILLA